MSIYSRNEDLVKPVSVGHTLTPRRKTALVLKSALVTSVATFVLGTSAAAQDVSDDVEALEEDVVVITGLRALPTDDVGSVFGFGKSVTEIPRSVSTISAEQIERFGITDIYGLVAQTPGTFTNSFFGVGGALDIRGQAGETYFRGIRRLDNPGNYPTPIGASDRIDIVRGPASPIYGPSKSGGYMNFVPKTARVSSGKYIDSPEGEVRFTAGSWNKSVLSASITGPATLGGQDFGYHVYGEIEDSGSYYDNITTNQTIFQAAFDTDFSDKFRVEFGGMYHDYDGVQNGGWNRLTQDLVDNGTYITGSAQPLDTDFDGQISPAEFDAAATGLDFSNFGFFDVSTLSFSPFASAFTDASFADSPYLALSNVGTTTLSRRNTLAGPDDTLENEMITVYVDFIYDNGDGLEVKNQSFYESYDNLNENSYGFSQFHASSVFENKLVATKDIDMDFVDASLQISPSIRNTNFKHGDDFSYEYFHRVDLTQGYSALSNRLLSSESGLNYDNFVAGEYTNYAIAGLADVNFDMGLSVLLGLRYDTIDVDTESFGDRELDLTSEQASDSDNGVSWNTSVSYKIPGTEIIPYVTLAKQSVVVAGQGAEIGPGDVLGESWFSATELTEFGVKGNFLDDTLYAAISYYDQERTDRNIQSSTVNQDISTSGIEAEMRWQVSDKFLISAAYTNTEIVNETYLENGTAFSFFGIEDLVNVSDPSLYLGGQPIGLVPIADKDAAKRAGIPENLFSATATYEFENGLSLSGSAVHVEEVFSGQSQVVTLPSYTLFDISGSYTLDKWLFRATVKNATNEEYFRANFTELFGSTIVLPEKPRSVEVTAIYKF